MLETIDLEGIEVVRPSVDSLIEFVDTGILTLASVVPAQMNAQLLDQLRAYDGDGYRFWHQSALLRSIYRLPEVAGAVRALVGAKPIYDHSFVHVVTAGKGEAQDWHADSVVDTRLFGFDILCFYYPHATTAAMGATLILPGSHLRRVKNGALSHYRNILGQRQLVCPAGTVVITHHGIWHCAQPNITSTNRYMCKARFRPGADQRGLFAEARLADPDLVRARFAAGRTPWTGAEGSSEHLRKAMLWRHLVGDERLDVSYESALTRMHI